mmetsp:Transcript_23430/g.41136  ORF Transcript_23430/g.41136 Transcript_23430/m.41136 type:complete len:340 (+) Transcript_23430:5335-6354(+)
MAQRHMTQFMGDDAGHLGGGHSPLPEFVVKPAGDENPPIRCGQPVDRLNLVDVDLDPVNFQRARQLVTHLAQHRIDEFGRFLVKFARSAPDRKAVHGKPIKHSQQDRGKFDHDCDMGRGALSGKRCRCEYLGNNEASGAPGDGDLGWPPKGPAFERGVARQGETPELIKEHGQGVVGDETARGGGPGAEMGPCTKGDRGARIACDVEAVRVRKMRLVPAGGAEHEENEVVPFEGDVAGGAVLGDTAGAHANRGDKPGVFVKGRCPSDASIIDQRFLVRMGKQRPDCARNGIARLVLATADDHPHIARNSVHREARLIKHRDDRQVGCSTKFWQAVLYQL